MVRPAGRDRSCRPYRSCGWDSRLPGRRPRPTMPRMSSAEPAADPFAARREAMRDEFFAQTLPARRLARGTDTYKRTMWAAVPDIAVARAGYTLTMRKGLPEPGAGNQLIMAGHEAMLAQWFHRPLRRDRHRTGPPLVPRARRPSARFPTRSGTPSSADQPGDDIYLPIDVWGFPGGQTFLPGVPCLVFEGMGGAISYLEPAMCRYFAPIIQATKARLMKAATPRDAEFGLRSAPDEADAHHRCCWPATSARRHRPTHLQRHRRVPLPRAVPHRRHHRPRDDVRRPVVRPHRWATPSTR